MAVIIPAVVSFVAAGGAAGIAAAAGAVAAGTAGLAAYATMATVAGGFLSTVGGLTKNQKLAKIGGYLSLAGGVGQIASGLMSGAAGAGTDSLVSDAASEAAAAEAAFNSGVSETASASLGDVASGASLGELGAQSAAQEAAQLGGQAAADAGAAAFTLPSAQPNLLELAQGSAAPQLDMGFGTNVLTQPGGVGNAAMGKLQAVGSEIKNQGHLQNLLDTMGNGANKLGEFTKNNKELVQLGGQFLQGGMKAYSDQAAMDEQLNLLEQRRRRLNSPIRMLYANSNVQPLSINLPGLQGSGG